MVMLRYPASLVKDDNGTRLVTFPDFADAVTFGETKEDALAHAVDALQTVIIFRMKHKLDIPKPSAARKTSGEHPAAYRRKGTAVPGAARAEHLHPAACPAAQLRVPGGAPARQRVPHDAGQRDRPRAPGLGQTRRRWNRECLLKLDSRGRTARAADCGADALEGVE